MHQSVPDHSGLWIPQRSADGAAGSRERVTTRRPPAASVRGRIRSNRGGGAGQKAGNDHGGGADVLLLLSLLLSLPLVLTRWLLSVLARSLLLVQLPLSRDLLPPHNVSAGTHPPIPRGWEDLLVATPRHKAGVVSTSNLRRPVWEIGEVGDHWNG
eukprot:gene2892-biopygen7381